MEYAIYPFLEIRITQRHDEGNHLAHWKPFKDYSDKPWDEASTDGGRSYFVPQNDYRIVEKSGSQTGGYNVRLETVNKVKIPYQEDSVILELTLTHLNYDDYSKLHEGQILKKNEKAIREGTSGQATGNHLHITANIGRYHGLKKNSNGKWVFVYDKSLTPPEAFYIDKKINKIIDSKGYTFQEVPSFLPPRGYFTLGDSGENVEKICEYFSNKVKGNYFGKYLKACVKVFQEENNIENDGNIGKITLSKMKEKGFKE